MVAPLSFSGFAVGATAPRIYSESRELPLACVAPHMDSEEMETDPQSEITTIREKSLVLTLPLKI